ncbi:MAG: efflux RND transporter periplasmic adaptor subunit [Bryobacteraceae bacterium]|nr:efflux RND transporter periplasmic adaptor subunit [Bryobacteraceae bacterium]
MKKILAVVAVAVVVTLSWAVYQRSNRPKEAPFVKVARETVVSAVTTNGRVEPLEWAAVSAERAGVLERVYVERGSKVQRGDLLAEVDRAAARAEVEAAEARVAQVRTELEVISAGGPAADLAEIQGELSRLAIELEAARDERAVQERLLAKQASTRQLVEEAARRVSVLEAQIASLEKRRAALAGPSGRAAAEARLREAQAGLEAARLQLEKALIRAPMAGVVYEFPRRLGEYLNPGDLVARVGRTGQVRVRVYVDEPELGRVALGMPVTISWDAQPGKRWQGKVERMPSEISTLGTRQIGEVICVIENPEGDLLPGSNVNAEIRSRVAENALTIPREALRRNTNQDGVLVLRGDRVEWRSIRLGVGSVTRVQVVEGLAEGDAVALPSQQPLAPGDRVRPVWR